MVPGDGQKSLSSLKELPIPRKCVIDVPESSSCVPLYLCNHISIKNVPNLLSIFFPLLDLFIKILVGRGGTCLESQQAKKQADLLSSRLACSTVSSKRAIATQRNTVSINK
ncbi:hypothetical protein, unlikely [Trypanosoma congolense IL3000]|jgi:hypothetical protein|uniref:Uncharacterized protein n=1 Tax=Trypanosoma congolense (strain IL3000) TaxID=1068625 RepID=F9W6J5_TRYCI|nr:hypothetical protein, unlikely [Trypanosoma congolense IL3000]